MENLLFFFILFVNVVVFAQENSTDQVLEENIPKETYDNPFQKDLINFMNLTFKTSDNFSGRKNETVTNTTESDNIDKAMEEIDVVVDADEVDAERVEDGDEVELVDMNVDQKQETRYVYVCRIIR